MEFPAVAFTRCGDGDHKSSRRGQWVEGQEGVSPRGCRLTKSDTDTAAIFRHKDDSCIGQRLVNGLDVGPARDREAVILFHAFYGGFGHPCPIGQFFGGPPEISPRHSQLSASNHRGDPFFPFCELGRLTEALKRTKLVHIRTVLGRNGPSSSKALAYSTSAPKVDGDRA